MDDGGLWGRVHLLSSEIAYVDLGRLGCALRRAEQVGHLFEPSARAPLVKTRDDFCIDLMPINVSPAVAIVFARVLAEDAKWRATAGC